MSKPLWGGARTNTGGKRPGAGRPRTNKEQLVIRVKPETRAKIITLAKEGEKTYGEVIEEKLDGEK